MKRIRVIWRRADPGFYVGYIDGQVRFEVEAIGFKWEAVDVKRPGGGIGSTSNCMEARELCELLAKGEETA